METNLITATLKYFSKSGNSAFITTKSNPFSMDSICGYILAEPILNLEPGATFKIPQGFVLKPMEKDGELFTTKNGEVRMKFTWPVA
jgi:hypothetical protein